MAASRVLQLVVVAVALVVALVLALAGRTAGDGAGESDGDGDRAGSTRGRLVSLPPRPSPASAASSAAVVSDVSPPPSEDHDAQRQLRRLARVSDALELLRFPPDSQPLHASMIDVLQPGARHERPLPLTSELSLLFTANTYPVASGSPLTATLEAFRGRSQEHRRRVPIDIRACTLSRFSQPDYRLAAVSLPLNDEGRAGDVTAADGVYSLTLVPSALPDLTNHNGLIRLDAEIVVEGEPAPVRVSLDFRLTSAAPAAFVGVARERLTETGLELDVDLRVQRAGRYFVQGLLFDARERPIGVAVARPSLEAGAATVSLVYWGLLFHEAAAIAPFTFRTLTGHRLPDAGEAERADMTTWDGSYRTRMYGPGDFSDKEHESTAKTRKVQAFGELVRQR